MDGEREMDKWMDESIDGGRESEEGIKRFALFYLQKRIDILT